MRIKEILASKGADVIVIAPEATVRDLVGLLNQHNLGAVVVSNGAGDVQGIVSERDIIRHLADDTPMDANVSAIMTSEVHTCAPADSVSDLMALMTERRIRHVPVVIDDQLSGIVSIGDIVKTHVGQLEFERDQLQGYVQG